MTAQASSGPAWVPDACTLPTAQRPLRRAEFDALFAAALLNSERVSSRHLRLTLAGAADLEAAVRDLTARESECCSFFTFTVTSPRPGDVRLDIEVPAGQVAVLDGLAGRAIGTRDTR
jgi:hypothetical protein